MRSLIAGFLGLCLTVTLLPSEASARADARASAQSGSSSRNTAAPSRSTASIASRSTASRPTAARSSATSSRASAVPSRQASSRTNAASSRHALTPRSATASRSASRDRATAGRSTSSRHAAAIPYGRQSATPQRGLRQTAMASCTTRNGRRSCAPSRTAAMSWTGGLAPAAMSQAGCPDGTIATNALGHNDITRCVPL